MTFYDISVMQRELDQHIFTLHQESQESTYRKRLLAFLVELGELANETRCFKFWSSKGPSERAIILDEYVDGIHFIVSLGNDLQFDFMSLSYKDHMNGTGELFEEFLCCYQSASAMIESFDSVRLKELIYAFFGLGHALGFTFDDIVEGYLKKNAINHQRQATKY